MRKTDISGRGGMPVILLMGLPETGKSAMLDRMAKGVHRPPSPVIRLQSDLSPPADLSKLVQTFAHRLIVDDKVKMPRTIFTLVVLGMDPNLPDIQLADELERTLDPRKDQAPDNLAQLGELAGLLPNVGPWLRMLIIGAGLVGRRVNAGERLYHDARAWLDKRVDGNIFGLTRDYHRGHAHEKAIARRMLVEAFLEDLAQAWAGRTYPRNCLLLLDGADHPVKSSFLQAIVDARTWRARESLDADPLLVVAASRTWHKGITGWTCPGTRGERRPPALGTAAYCDWLERRGPAEPSYWYPVLMPEAEPAETTYGPAIATLTGGYAGAVRELTALLGGARDDDDFRAILHRARTLDRLPHLPSHRDQLTAWSAARCVDDAENALPDGTNQASRLRHDLAAGLWLTSLGGEANRRGIPASRDGKEVVVLHPWLRRLLLHRLAGDPQRWDQAHEAMESYYRRPEVADEVSAMYHRLARVTDKDDSHLDEVVSFLAEKMTELDVRDQEDTRLAEWVRIYEQVTTAPNRLPLDRPLDALYDALVAKRSGAGPSDRACVIRTLVVDRWFHLDPLLDPRGRRRSNIRLQLPMLQTSTGAAFFGREAERYDDRGR
ncbi:hypothetical protein FE391_16470 [Nonomuraea sp. KC401]|uniref:hypothetical protein n=1 Tax=unclassified Nonomuraea TaxID=2593643 RepID=UPI0010FF487A|nr:MULTISPECIES: hypothetical protein [unclassified Nonomuraea]NBE94604.1 hypothetical protein [Nonomuraea sp. K271]TLF72653.1 hypothetical protein FE391_16470 [Nonomuraea sp. KC401]